MAARDPVGAFRFVVTIGATEIGFAEVTGIGCEIHYDPDAIGGDDGDRGPHARVTDVHLRRGITGDGAVWSWFESVMGGSDDPRTVTVTLLDATNAPCCSWVLAHARPTQYVGPHLIANAAAPAMEEIVLSAESIAFRT